MKMDDKDLKIMGQNTLYLDENMPKIGRLLRQVYDILPEGTTLTVKAANQGKFFELNYLKSENDFSLVLSKLEP